jgi:hypothetical protein
VEKWKERTETLKNDQLALNLLLNPNSLPLEPEFNIEGIHVKTWPAEIYNFYYFPENHDEAKILHYKNNLCQKVQT